MKKIKHTEAFIDQWVASGKYEEFGLYLSHDLILKIEEILYKNYDDKAKKKIRKLLYEPETNECQKDFPMKNYVSIRTMSANSLEEAIEKVENGEFTEENVLCDAVLPEAFIHTCSSEQGRVFWVIEESDQGRIDHFCNLEAIPEIWHQNSKFQFRQLWNHVFTRINLWQLNELFEANRIKFRFKK